ncbi:MAG: hypothetical protein PHD65_07220 [Gallionella sp.]|nr:hypothetical protein [Gallionella sp.]
MQNTFTVHCIPWQAGAPLLQAIRVAASKTGLMDQAKAQADKLDEQCRHALALSKNGDAIGCARITQDGRIERMVVLPHEQRALVETALTEVLNDYSNLRCKQ